MASEAYTGNQNLNRTSGSVSCGYYDNRYWTMWKLPMFGCTDASQVIKEVDACSKSFPAAYVRVIAFGELPIHSIVPHATIRR